MPKKILIRNHVDKFNLINIYLFQTYLLLLFIFSNCVAAADSNRQWEERLNEKFKQTIPEESLVWLGTKENPHLGIYTPPNNSTFKGAVILLHASGAHADWPQLISPLRTRLPEAGWATMSLQMPILSPQSPNEDYGKTLTEAVERIEHAIAYFREQRIANIVLLGHSFGAVDAMQYLVTHESNDVKGLILIGLHTYPFLNPSVSVLNQIEQIKIPVLDLYGSGDYRDVIKQSEDRRSAAIKGKNKNFVQYEINGAGHYFMDYENDLLRVLKDWLNQLLIDRNTYIPKDIHVDVVPQQ